MLINYYQNKTLRFEDVIKATLVFIMLEEYLNTINYKIKM